MTRIRKTKLEEAMTNWPTLVEVVMELNEQEIEELLKREQTRDPPRPQFLSRIHQRLSKVRSQREREEIMKGVKP